MGLKEHKDCLEHLAHQDLQETQVRLDSVEYPAASVQTAQLEAQVPLVQPVH